MASRSNEIILPICIADAFTKEPFGGNPAAVCMVPFQQVLPNNTRQKIAAEMNLSETAFISIIKENDSFQSGKRFGLKWFTPKCEVPLCGHATLASSAVLFSVYNNQSPVLEFETISGILKAKQLQDGKIEIDLPAYNFKPANIEKFEDVIKAAVGSLPFQEVFLSSSCHLMIRLKDECTRQQLEGLKPRYDDLLKGLPEKCVIVTLKGSGSNDCVDGEGKAYDFMSRFFAPWFGVPEDPVCGSAHCVLTPYWSEVLGKTELYARQCSSRGGDLSLRLAGERVAIGGHSVVVVRGQIHF